MQYEKCGKKNFFAEVYRQKAPTKLHRLDYSEESSSNSQHTLSKRRLPMLKQERSDKWHLYWWR